MRLVVAIDGRSGSEDILRRAKRIATVFGADVEAVHVGHERDADARRAARACDAPLRLADGPVLPALQAAAAGEDVLGLVAGAGVGDETRLTGHVAAELMAALPGMLVLVPRGGSPHRPVRRILAPLDGTAETARALEQVLASLADATVEIVVLHVIAPGAAPPFADQTHHWCTAFSREFCARHLPHREVTAALGADRPATGVLDAAAERDADLVVLAWHQRLDEGQAEVVRGAIAHGGFPVLLVPTAPA